MRAPPHSRLGAAIVLGLIFCRELWLSAVAVARAVFSRSPDISPAIIAVPVDLRTRMGVATVANLISLTPGTTSLHTNGEGTIIYVHCLDARDEAEVIAGIRDNFEYWVRRVEG